MPSIIRVARWASTAQQALNRRHIVIEVESGSLDQKDLGSIKGTKEMS
jgi:hypothetical protein